MKQINLSQGLFATVDDADYETLSKHKWYAVKYPHTTYAKTNIYIDGKRRAIGMHRIIMGINKDAHIDHIDHNGLNNCRANLRTCTIRQNSFNRARYPGSQFKGIFVRRQKGHTSYVSVVKKNQKRYYAGTYRTPEDAARAYDRKAIELFGEFACVNFHVAI